MMLLSRRPAFVDQCLIASIALAVFEQSARASRAPWLASARWWSNECGDFRSWRFGGVSARPRCAAIRGRAVVVEKSEAIGPEADLKLSVLELTNRSGARGTHGKVGSQHCSVGSQWERNSQLQMTYQSSQPPFRAALMLPRGYIL